MGFIRRASQWWRRVQRVWRLVEAVEWPCAYCYARSETPILVWNQLRYQLLCARCSYMQNYPDHVAAFDPDPPDHILERRRHAS